MPCLLIIVFLQLQLVHLLFQSTHQPNDLSYSMLMPVLNPSSLFGYLQAGHMSKVTHARQLSDLVMIG